MQADGFGEEVQQVCQIALLSMSEVVLMLTMKSDQSIPAPMKPAFLDRKNLKDTRTPRQTRHRT